MTDIITIDIDGDGIATLTWDDPGAPVNTLGEASITAFANAIETVAANNDVTGIVVTSGKRGFIAGADLKMLRTLGDATPQAIYDMVRGLQGPLRALETCGKPVVAAINGTALGGGYEVALACHHRIAADDPKAQIGLPEAGLGLLPGAGGTQRLPRMIGAINAIPILTQGKKMPPRAALEAGLVDEVVTPDGLLDAAKAWIKESPTATQPWDEKKFRIPGGAVQTPKVFQHFVGANGHTRKATWNNYPAPQAILACVYHGLQMPLDPALKYEARRFTELAQGAVAQNMIRTLFFAMGEANKLARRPEGVPKATFKKVGVLGAGMMGAGIAWQCALVGMEVVLIDRTQDHAEKGKAYSEGLAAKRVKRGRMSEVDAAMLLARITPTTDYALLDGADIVVEAVFEDRAIKADVTQKSEAVIGPDAIFASNTSTLPITGLAEASNDAKRFIGLHFFSPVDKMKLVEIIVGEHTSDETLARSMDFVQAIKRTPIVVTDRRGFFTSRVFKTYILEGIAMLREGVDPMLLDNAGRMAGMPVGPLALTDEVSLELIHRISGQTRRDLGDDYVEHPAEPVITHMVEVANRLGKKTGKGFYDYPDDGPKRIWCGLREQFIPRREQPDPGSIGERLLAIQAVETVRCLDEGVLLHPADADVGSILGWGFCPFHGGVLSYIDTVGVAAFVERCDALAEAHGERFTPPQRLRDMAAAGETFHG